MSLGKGKGLGPRASASVQLAAQRIAGRPGDDDLERLYASELDWGRLFLGGERTYCSPAV